MSRLPPTARALGPRALAVLAALWGLGGGGGSGAWGSGAAARAASPLEVERALHAWDTEAAARAVAEWEAREGALGPGAPAERLAAAGHTRLLQGRYAEAARLLDLAVREGGSPGVAQLAALAAATRDATAGFVRRLSSGGHFALSYAPGPDAVLVPYADEALEAAWEALTSRFGYAPPGPVRVEFLASPEVLAAVSPLTVEEIKTSGTIALCKYDRLMIVSPRALVYGYAWRDTLAHEFVHLLVTRSSRNTVPIWLHEGLAKYYESAWRGPRAPHLERSSEDLLARALEDGKLVSFEAMSPSMAKLPSQEATATAFAEVFTVMEFLVERAGPQGPPRIPTMLAAGRSDREAIATLAGVPWAGFQRAWEDSLRRRGLRKLPKPAELPKVFQGEDADAATLRMVPEERARRLTWLADQFRLKGRYKAAAKTLRRAAALVGPATPVVQAKLGDVLLQQGKPEEAVKVLQKPLGIFDRFVLLHLYLGRAQLALGHPKQARRHLERVLDLNPFDPDVHRLLQMAYEALGLTPLAQREERAQALLTASPAGAPPVPATP